MKRRTPAPSGTPDDKTPWLIGSFSCKLLVNIVAAQNAGDPYLKHGSTQARERILSNLPPIELPELQPGDELTSEIVPHPQAGNESTLARQIALQVLYEVDVTRHAAGDVLNRKIRNTTPPLPRRTVNYMRRLVLGVNGNRVRLDALIERYASEFPLAMIAPIDRNILRLALFEFIIDTETPRGVAIDEAIELAKIFGSEGSSRFVNGVLGAVAQDADELIAHPPAAGNPPPRPTPDDKSAEEDEA